MNVSKLLLSILALAVILAGRASAQEQIPEPAIKAWREYELKLRQGVSYERRYLRSQKSGLELDVLISLKRCGERFYVQTLNTKIVNDRIPGKVFAVNDQYRFELNKNKPEGFWAVKRFEPKVEGKNQTNLANVVYTYKSVMYSDVFFNPNFPSPLNLFSFSGTTVQNMETNESGIVTVTWTIEDPDNELDAGAARGEISFDPSRDWLLTGWKFPLPDGVRIGENSDIREIDGMFIPFKQEVRGTVGGVVVDSITHTFSKLEFGQYPQTEFTLTAFGISEIGTESGSKPNFPWLMTILIGFGIVAIAGGFLVKRFKNR